MNNQQLDEINWKEKGLTEEHYKEIYKNYSLTIMEDEMNELDNLRHNVIENNIEYKYGVAVKNTLPFSALIPAKDVYELPKTATENLFDLLEIDKDSSYESLILKYHQEYNTGI
jgi:hypothetical protein